MINNFSPWFNPAAAYLHIPFCAHHCGYCDFAVASGQDHLIDLYVEAIGAELATLNHPAPMQTLFLGGGTPTYLSAEQLERFLQSVRRWLPLETGGEFSIESTPESITPEKMDVLAKFGVTRVSIGVQSFHPHLLPVLDRRHGPEHVGPAVAAVRKHGMQLSLDLIFGVPGQSLDDWRQDLDWALELGSDHLSTYGLTYEKGTPLWKDRERGGVKALDEEAELGMYLLAMDHLAKAGFEHYEISNFARPGHRCRHNEAYWANHAYLGFGLGAARYVQGRREVNTRNLKEYLKRVLAGEPATFQSEELTPEERARETAVVQLRRSDGIFRTSFQQQTGFSLDDLMGQKIIGQTALGLLRDDGERVWMTREGKCVADSLATDWL
ncbi:MAG: radical SAM family heme chaperone HemW [Planctomycetes bacterium]|nr:radical SAM family heme chaperone HemW [Planctomycetota bacterium]